MKINSVLDDINKARALGSSNQCYEVMYSIARSFQVETVVEIGTHKGASSIVFCQAILDNGKIPTVYTIDSWAQSDTESEAKSNFVKAGFDKYIVMIRGDSTVEISKLFQNVKADLVLIDGNHEFEAVTRDYENCKEFTRLIFFHDTCFGNQPYLLKATQDGWSILNFPTRYVEGDGHNVGIALAYK